MHRPITGVTAKPMKSPLDLAMPGLVRAACLCM
jgi:hypothetical protein